MAKHLYFLYISDLVQIDFSELEVKIFANRYLRIFSLDHSFQADFISTVVFPLSKNTFHTSANSATSYTLRPFEHPIENTA